MENTRLLASLIRGLLYQIEAFENHHRQSCTADELESIGDLRLSLLQTVAEAQVRLGRTPQSERTFGFPPTATKQRRASNGGLQ